jgi:hypothetical protein
LFARLGATGLTAASLPEVTHLRHGKGHAWWVRRNPVELARRPDGAATVLRWIREAWQGRYGARGWRETNYLLLRRGPYVVAAGLDESVEARSKPLAGRFLNLFDPTLATRTQVALTPGSRWFLLDLDRVPRKTPAVLAAAVRTLPISAKARELRCWVEGVADTPAVVAIAARRAPRGVTLAGEPLADWRWDPVDGLLRVGFPNASAPRELRVVF